MKNLREISLVIVAGAVSAMLLMGQAPPSANDEKAKLKAANKAKQIAKNFENNASVLTLYDRAGKTVGTVGERALYNGYVLSPDKTRVAVVRPDQMAENADLYILDVAMGKEIRLTTGAARDFVQGVVWSPDSKQVAYVAFRAANEGLYRRAANGEGPEEVLYKNPGAGMNLSDWSQDGRFLAFSKSDLAGGVLYILPLSGEGERKPTEVFKSESRMFAPRFSPDGRYLSYVSVNGAQRAEGFVRTVEPSGSVPAQLGEIQSAVFWNRDGKEVYYVGLDRNVMLAEVSTTPAFKMGTPKILFRPPGAVPVNIGDISGDGERFVAVPPRRGPQLQQITIYDRDGEVVSKVGDPGLYNQPAFSPDGKRLVVMKGDLEKSTQDIWTIDLATGKQTRVTNDAPPKNAPMWSPDGKQILYTSLRGSYMGVYRRASDGTGDEEFLFRYTPGAGINLTDISPDGKYLAIGSGGVVLVVALTGDPMARQAIEFMRDEFNLGNGRFSPDGKFLAFISNELDDQRNEVYVRPFNAATGMAGEGKWQLSKDGAAGMQTWRADGKEFFFRQAVAPGTDDFVLMAAEVSTAPTFQSTPPKALFKLPGPINGNLGNISRDGQRVVFAINVPAN